MLRLAAAVALILACACSSTSKNEGGSSGGSGGSAGGGGTGGGAGTVPGDAGGSAPCAADFGEPSEVTELNALSGGAVRAWLSEDETTIWFATNGSGGHDIWRGTAPAPEQPFGGFLPLANVNDATAPDHSPTVTKDGTTLYFTSLRSGNNELYRAELADGGPDFGAPALVENLNSAQDDGMPSVSGSGTLLVFRSNRLAPDAGDDFDLFETKDNGFGFSNPEPISLLSSSFYESFPALRSDGLELYYSTTRPEGSKGGAEIWRTSRAAATEPWGAPEIVAEVNSADQDYPNWISPDGCTLYLHRKLGNGEQKLYVARREKTSSRGAQ